jgi:hypothetical protein
MKSALFWGALCATLATPGGAAPQHEADCRGVHVRSACLAFRDTHGSCQWCTRPVAPRAGEDAPSRSLKVCTDDSSASGLRATGWTCRSAADDTAAASAGEGILGGLFDGLLGGGDTGTEGDEPDELGTAHDTWVEVFFFFFFFFFSVFFFFFFIYIYIYKN